MNQRFSAQHSTHRVVQHYMDEKHKKLSDMEEDKTECNNNKTMTYHLTINLPANVETKN